MTSLWTDPLPKRPPLSELLSVLYTTFYLRVVWDRNEKRTKNYLSTAELELLLGSEDSMILAIIHDITTDRSATREAVPERVIPAPLHNYLFISSLREKWKKYQKLFISGRVRASARIRIIHDLSYIPWYRYGPNPCSSCRPWASYTRSFAQVFIYYLF